MSVQRIATGLLALALGAAACTSGDDDPSTTPATNLSGDEIVLTSALVTVDSCEALLDHLRTEGAERVGAYGFGQGGPVFAFGEEMEMAEDDAMEAETTTDSAVAASAPVDGATRADGGTDEFSGTNNQEADVDEADLVKTDGRRLVIVSGNQLQIIDVTGEIPRLTDTVQLPDEFWGGELFLSGDTALLMTSGWTAEPFARDAIDTSWFPGAPTGRILEIDLAAGEVGTTMDFEGSYLSAREVDGSIRIVLTAAENRFNFVFPSNPGAEDTAAEANKRLIAESTIDMWIPTYRVTDADGTVTEGPIVECDQVHLPGDFAGFGSLVVLTVDIEDGLQLQDSLSVFTDGQTVYASTDRLAVATPRWPDFDADGALREDDDYRTAIHTFDIADPTTTSYNASGTVRGHLLNQFSMSEHEGYLRVATTDGTPWDSRNSESFVTVLSEVGGELAQVGQVGGLGEGEQIFAVRFLGDIGYVVTFEQIDPLYSIDLSDPENPVTRGELKIPGFSSYLHPWGDYLIGIGTDGDDEGRTFGAVASLFDVSDIDDPQLVDKVSLAPTAPENLDWFDSSSPVSWDAKAFNAWEDTIIVPVSWWGYAEGADEFQDINGNGAALIRVDTESGTFQPIGRIGHPETRECEGGRLPVEPVEEQIVVESIDGATTNSGGDADSGDAEAEFSRGEEPPAADVEAIRPAEEFCWTYQPEIRRSVVIGDDLYTISDAGVAVNTFDGLESVTWIPFERR
ncbi:MAG: beta-propeller domain-containing protein [Actinomycetota bacterium]